MLGSDLRSSRRPVRPALPYPPVQICREVAGDLTRVLVEQVGAVDVQRLGRRVGRLTAEEMWSIDEALVVVLGLD